MILTCPQCETRYQADASKFSPPGRKVRCAKCGHVWHQEAPATDLEPKSQAAAAEPETPQIPAETPTTAMDPELQRLAVGATDATPSTESVVAQKSTASDTVERKSKSVSRAPQNIGLTVGWLGLVAVILLIGWSALSYRQQIATVWPRAASLYSALGLHVNTRGLDFVDVALHREAEDGQQVWAVTGKLVNVSAHEQPVPSIEATLTDINKHAIYHWSFNSGAAVLKPGQTAAFLTRLSSPPAGARHLELRFAASGG